MISTPDQQNNGAVVNMAPTTDQRTNNDPTITISSSSSEQSSPSGSISGSSLTRSLNTFRIGGSYLNPYFGESLFDGNTFKQIKRLYCGMLMVAIAYSITMVIMMVVLYKSLPDSSFNSQEQYSSSNIPIAVNVGRNIFDHETNLLTVQDHGTMMYPASRPPSAYHHHHPSSPSMRTYLDQVIAINFITSILYILSFYAAHREFYNLTLAFTTCMAVSMVISLVKILTEGTHLPNNLMGLLLRASIVFVALIYCSQIRRKQEFVRHANSLWLASGGTTGSNLVHRSGTTAVQFLNELLLSNQQQQLSSRRIMDKSEEQSITGIDDMPPDYEEALGCPMPRVRPVPVELVQPPSQVVSISGSNSALAPPSFESSSSSS